MSQRASLEQGRKPTADPPKGGRKSPVPRECPEQGGHASPRQSRQSISLVEIDSGVPKRLRRFVSVRPTQLDLLAPHELVSAGHQ